MRHRLRSLIPALNRADGYRRRLIATAFEAQLAGTLVSEIPGFHAPGLVGRYFVTSNGGVFFVAEHRLLKLFAGPCYGMDRIGNQVFLSVVLLDDSYILRGTLPDRIEPGAKIAFTVLGRLPGSDRNRVHQICAHDGRIAVADTARNRILLIDPDGDAPTRAVHPFMDRLDQPIGVNHNHLNSVFSCGESLLFCAYRVRNGEGGLGVIGKDGAYLHPVEHAGIHGVYVRGSDLWYGDSMGPGGGGRLVCNGEPWLADSFSGAKNYWVRGAAGTDDEVLVGHSKRGDRVERFRGRGKLLICREGRVTEVEFPAGQIYDIRREDGRHFGEAPALLETGAVRERLAAFHPDTVDLEPAENMIELPKNVVSGAHHLY